MRSKLLIVVVLLGACNTPLPTGEVSSDVQVGVEPWPGAGVMNWSFSWDRRFANPTVVVSPDGAFAPYFATGTDVSLRWTTRFDAITPPGTPCNAPAWIQIFADSLPQDNVFTEPGAGDNGPNGGSLDSWEGFMWATTPAETACTPGGTLVKGSVRVSPAYLANAVLVQDQQFWTDDFADHCRWVVGYGQSVTRTLTTTGMWQGGTQYADRALPGTWTGPSFSVTVQCANP
jgi:hypothetical protein